VAVALLEDLQAVFERTDQRAEFTRRFDVLRGQHHRKPSLLERFDQAGLGTQAAHTSG
jgi:hypothetical protein